MYVRVLDSFCERYVSKESGATRGFNPESTYRVHKIESYSDTGNGYVVLVNDFDEIWWVDNRHVRVTSESDFAMPPAQLDIPIRALGAGPYLW
jgi:hypothetical protein